VHDVDCVCRDLRARLELAIERVLELAQQVEKQKAVSPSHSRRSSSCEEVQLLLLLLLLTFKSTFFRKLLLSTVDFENRNTCEITRTEFHVLDSLPVAAKH